MARGGRIHLNLPNPPKGSVIFLLTLVSPLLISSQFFFFPSLCSVGGDWSTLCSPWKLCDPVVRKWFLSVINRIIWVRFKISPTKLAYSTYTYSNHALSKVEMIKSVFYVKFSTIIVIVCTVVPPPSKKESSTAYMSCLLTYLQTCLEKDHLEFNISRWNIVY